MNSFKNSYFQQDPHKKDLILIPKKPKKYHHNSPLQSLQKSELEIDFSQIEKKNYKQQINQQQNQSRGKLYDDEFEGYKDFNKNSSSMMKETSIMVSNIDKKIQNYQKNLNVEKNKSIYTRKLGKKDFDQMLSRQQTTNEQMIKLEGHTNGELVMMCGDMWGGEYKNEIREICCQNQNNDNRHHARVLTNSGLASPNRNMTLNDNNNFTIDIGSTKGHTKEIVEINEMLSNIKSNINKKILEGKNPFNIFSEIKYQKSMKIRMLTSKVKVIVVKQFWKD